MDSGGSTLAAIDTEVIQEDNGHGLRRAGGLQLVQPLLGGRHELPRRLSRSLRTRHQTPTHKVTEQRVKGLYGVVPLGFHHPVPPSTTNAACLR